MTKPSFDHVTRTLSRREFVIGTALVNGALIVGTPFRASASSGHERDWEWLVGDWDVWHRRLKDRLVGSNTWEEFGGKSALWLTLGGLGTVDDNIVDLPAGSYRGVTLRAFHPESGNWSIWWIDGRNPTHIDPPVIGRFEHDTGIFVGRDTFKGVPIVMRFRWNDIHSARPWWEQAFSTDDGASWEVNWRNYFTRTSREATVLPKLPAAPTDWDFLVGRWSVRHRRLAKRLVGSKDWQTFDGTLVNWPVLGGHGNVGDNVMNFPGGAARGLGFRTFDPATRQWSSWWLDSRQPSVITAPLRGAFAGGVGTFLGNDTLDGRSIKTRVQWFVEEASSIRWEQASSADDGRTWETNWISEFSRGS